MTADEAYQRLKHHPDLPTPKGVALQVMRLARTPGRSLTDLAEVVETDPAIAARLIRLVNSAAFPHHRPILSLTETVAYLGTKTVEGVALSFSLMSARVQCRSFDYPRFWSESLARAVAACELAGRLTARIPDEMFTAGLLARLGQLVFACTSPDAYDTLLSSIRCDLDEMCELERELFGIDHNDLTARLMADWSFPEAICKAVVLQGTLTITGSDDGTERLAAILRLSSRVASHVVADPLGHRTADDLPTEAPRLGLDGKGFTDMVSHVIARWREVADLFALDEMTDRQTHAMYAEAATLRKTLGAGP